MIKVRVGRELVAEKVVLADNARLRKKGVTGRDTLAQNEGVLLVMPPRFGLSLLQSIHMFGVPFELAVAWLDAQGEILEARLAHPGRIYFPSGVYTKARYILEVHPDHLPLLQEGSPVTWEVRDA